MLFSLERATSVLLSFGLDISGVRLPGSLEDPKVNALPSDSKLRPVPSAREQIDTLHLGG